MSSEAVGWVYRHSPYEGAAFCVHLAIADSVNDQHRNEFWLSAAKLAKKSRVGRWTALRCLEKIAGDGYLKLIVRGGGRSKPSKYRFVFKRDADVVFDSRETVLTDDRFDDDAGATSGIGETVRSRGPLGETVLSEQETVLSRHERVLGEHRHETQENPKNPSFKPETASCEHRLPEDASADTNGDEEHPDPNPEGASKARAMIEDLAARKADPA